MLPVSTVHQLTPIAAKVYVTLLTLANGRHDARVPLDRLARAANLSPASCKRGIAQLHKLSLIAHLRRRYHQPNTFLLPHALLGPPSPP